ncbi:biotin--[acetyl-CoA-carboxylase] ligase [Cellulomonas pakistanensis]|uniref:biotin--[biotin carboxyl-carrier protein] ligase n=1 Tax=Cellulomonas pakistanensis TaxID=992287 RepID=A0A919U2R0_9CELL|nr:biotin--[acetyl-CoA-carboxylase] ligase [Cellulomonas pakistanensis]GIG36353.1 biotin--[acetyl-CoA-carboxylase] ligase [Cellulomonas pakistanensis]
MDETDRDDPARGPLRVDEVRAALLHPAGPLRRCAVLPEAGSTSTELLARVAEDPAWADAGLLVAEHQRAGRGRAGHTWTTPPGAALTLSLAVRPGVPRDRWGWLPLLAGLAVVRAVRAATGLAAGLKWPNDVLVPGADGADLPGWGRYRKAAGLLAEVAPGGDAVVLGIGLNVAQRADELPVASATSLRAAGAAGVDRTALLVAVVREVDGVLAPWRDHGGDVAAAGLDAAVAGACLTLGAGVRATLPDGSELRGTAERIDADGALVLRDAAGSERVLLAGDVRHVRPVGELGSLS